MAGAREDGQAVLCRAGSVGRSVPAQNFAALRAAEGRSDGPPRVILAAGRKVGSVGRGRPHRVGVGFLEGRKLLRFYAR